VTGLPLVRTEFPGVYRRGARYVVVYRVGGRQCEQAAPTGSTREAGRAAGKASAADIRARSFASSG
jgi:hypothetical protein